jgi:hypothetical protein
MRSITTYVSVLNKVIENPINLTSEEVEKLTALRDSIAKRNATKSDKPTKAQRENAELAEKVASTMVEGVTYSIPDLCALLPELAGASSQKVGPLMQKLVDAGKAVKSVVKGHNYYTLA